MMTCCVNLILTFFTKFLLDHTIFRLFFGALSYWSFTSYIVMSCIA